jgi:hypothetical protein
VGVSALPQGEPATSHFPPPPYLSSYCPPYCSLAPARPAACAQCRRASRRLRIPRHWGGLRRSRPRCAINSQSARDVRRAGRRAAARGPGARAHTATAKPTGAPRRAHRRSPDAHGRAATARRGGARPRRARSAHNVDGARACRYRVRRAQQAASASAPASASPALPGPAPAPVPPPQASLVAD